MKIKYSSDVDVLTIQLREGKLWDSCDLAEGVIVHLARNGQPLQIEILDASTTVEKKHIELSMEPLFPK